MIVMMKWVTDHEACHVLSSNHFVMYSFHFHSYYHILLVSICVKSSSFSTIYRQLPIYSAQYAPVPGNARLACRAAESAIYNSLS